MTNPFTQLGYDHVFGARLTLPIEERRKHIHIIGKSGMGKTTLLKNIFAQEANAGRSIVLVDPHGDLARACADLVPKHRIRKTIYWNISDLDRPIGFNLLDQVPADLRSVVAGWIIDAIQAVWPHSWGPRMNRILLNTLLALMEMPGSTLLSIQKMLLDDAYRAKVKRHIQDPITRYYWDAEFAVFEDNSKFGGEAITPVLNKIGEFMTSDALRNIFGQPKTAFNPRHLIDNAYIVIVNLAQQKVSEQQAALIGSFIIATFGAAALSRSDTADEQQRPDTLMIVDEFQNYATERFAKFLSEARKFRLSLCLAHQYLDQLSEPIRAAIIGNAASRIIFQVGELDLELLAILLAPIRKDAINDYLVPGMAYIKMEGRDAKLIRTMHPPTAYGRGETIIAHSRHQWASARSTVAEKISRFFSQHSDPVALRPAKIVQNRQRFAHPPAPTAGPYTPTRHNFTPAATDDIF